MASSRTRLYRMSGVAWLADLCVASPDAQSLGMKGSGLYPSARAILLLIFSDPSPVCWRDGAS